MAEWNPNGPALLGPEFVPLAESGVTIDSGIKNAAMAWKQTTSQQIDSLKLYVDALPVRGGLFGVEVYDGAAPSAGGQNLDTVTARPNEDVSGTGSSASQWREDNGTTTTIYTEIDEASLNTADYIYTILGASPGAYYGRFNTGGLSLTSKRILSLKMRVRTISAYTEFGGSNGDIEWGLNISSVDYAGYDDYSPGNTWREYTWKTNPATGAPWTIAEVQTFDTTNEFYLRASGSSGRYVIVAMVELVVTICDEDRIAVGVLDDTASALTAGAWNEATMTTPTGGAWTKDGADYHTVVVRRLNSTGAITIRRLDSDTAPDVGYELPSLTLNSTYGYISSAGSAGTNIIPVVPVWNTGPADSVDAQPYASLVEALVFTGQEAGQEVSDAGVAVYGQVGASVKPNSATADLEVELWEQGGSQLSGTATIPSDLEVDGLVVVSVTELDDGWYRVVVNLPSPPTLAAATQYYIKFASDAAGTGSDYWSVQAGHTEGSGDTATYNGTTDRATLNGGDSDEHDLFATLSGSPTAIADLAVALTEQQRDPSPLGQVGLIYMAVVSWTATGLGGTFGHIELQRSIDGGTTWATIRRVWDDAITSVTVGELPRNAEACFRARVYRADGAVSDWTSSVCITTPSVECELLFVSDYDSSLNCIYDRRPTVEYDWLDGSAGVEVPLYSRDYQLAFKSPYTLGVRESYTLPIGVGADNPPPGNGYGRAALAPLLAIATADLPYVCVLDHEGGLLYARLRVPRSTGTNPGNRHVAQVTVTQLTATPYIVDVGL